MQEVNQESGELIELLELYGDLQHALEDTDAFRMKSKIEKVLMGLGFSEDDFDKQTEEFSGGWQMRIALAKLLLLQPSLLLLDEPTNHLDLDSLQWLEEYLRRYEGAVMIVSHDRRFLDNMTTKTYELSLGSLVEYPGNFSYYVEAKRERQEQQRLAFRNQQLRIQHAQRFIERFRYKATKARQVQSRIKALERMERIEIEDEESGIHFAFPPAPRSGRTAMELRNIHKCYGSNTLFNGIDLDIGRNDKVAFVGVNGSGKSTLARIVAGIEPFSVGERKPGHNVVLSYFAQHQAEELDPEKEVLQTVDEVATGVIRTQLRRLLACFLFRGDDVFKKVGVLSGGEKSRLALAKMLLQPSNLIVMDEPTNHLDMRSKGILQMALAEFDGSCVIVSHDRDFLDPLVNKVVEFRRGRIATYVGNVSDYLSAKQREQAEPTESVGDRDDIRAQGGRSEARLSDKGRKRLEAEQRQQRYERAKPIQDEIAIIERMIEEKDREKSDIETLMGRPDFYHDGQRVKEITTQYKLLEKELNDHYFKWGELTKKLEKIWEEFGC
jgi:ATP-binding cassette subfamily F protein 3